MSDRSLQRGIRVIFEIIRTGRPARRTSASPAWWRWFLALLGIAVAAAVQWIVRSEDVGRPPSGFQPALKTPISAQRAPASSEAVENPPNPFQPALEILGTRPTGSDQLGSPWALAQRAQAGSQGVGRPPNGFRRALKALGDFEACSGRLGRRWAPAGPVTGPRPSRLAPIKDRSIGS